MADKIAPPLLCCGYSCHRCLRIYCRAVRTKCLADTTRALWVGYRALPRARRHA